MSSIAGGDGNGVVTGNVSMLDCFMKQFRRRTHSDPSQSWLGKRSGVSPPSKASGPAGGAGLRRRRIYADRGRLTGSTEVAATPVNVNLLPAASAFPVSIRFAFALYMDAGNNKSF